MKNNIKRIGALLIAVMMLLAVAAPALAQAVKVGDDELDGSLTISNATIGQEYKIYKLFDATVTEGRTVYTLPAGKTRQDLLDSAAAAWFDVSSSGEISAKGTFSKLTVETEAFKTWAKAWAGTHHAEATATDNSLVFSQIPHGYYLVESALGAVVSIDSANPNAVILDKNQEPSWDNGDEKPGKVIIENGQKVTVNEANLDEPIQFDIGVNAKNYNAEHKIYRYIIDDNFASGMTYITDTTHPFVVKVGGVELKPEDPYNEYSVTYYTGTERDAAHVTTNLAEAQGFRVLIPWTNDGTADTAHKYDNAVEIHVNYYGKLDSAKAANVEYVNANLNKSTFNWWQDNDEPEEGKDPDHQQPERQTETYTTSLKIFKYRMDNGAKVALEGAEFTLTSTDGGAAVVYTTGIRFVEDENGTFWKLKSGSYTATNPEAAGVDKSLYESETQKYKKETFTEVRGSDQTVREMKGFVDEKGYIEFKGIAEGTYTISETVVPQGYNKAEDVTFKVTFDPTTKKFKSDNANVTMGSHFNLEIENKTGKELPTTGGIGTTIFYVVGAILVIGAGIVLVARRKANSK